MFSTVHFQSPAQYCVASSSFYPQKKALQAKREVTQTLVECAKQVLEFHSAVYSEKKKITEARAAQTSLR